MIKITMSELTRLEDKNNQEIMRLLGNFERHLQDFEAYSKHLKLEAIRKNINDLGGSNVNGNPHS